MSDRRDMPMAGVLIGLVGGLILWMLIILTIVFFV